MYSSLVWDTLKEVKGNSKKIEYNFTKTYENNLRKITKLNKAGFTPECEQNVNANTAGENNANIWCGTFVHCSASAEATNWPCSQAIKWIVCLHLNVSYANSLWSTDSWQIAFGYSLNIRRIAECCLPRHGNTSTSNVRIVFTCRFRILFAFRCKPGF